MIYFLNYFVGYIYSLFKIKEITNDITIFTKDVMCVYRNNTKQIRTTTITTSTTITTIIESFTEETCRSVILVFNNAEHCSLQSQEETTMRWLKQRFRQRKQQQ